MISDGAQAPRSRYGRRDRAGGEDAAYETLQLDHMVEKCQTAIANCKRPIRWWRQWWVGFAVGLAIGLIIWKLQQ
ncbi:MAG: hypothetical protein MUF72_11020 [Elainella sp. Prado103]|nr:hypothetical protein [Elainella sp. Prado103]